MNTFEISVQRKRSTSWPVVEPSASGELLPLRYEGTLQPG
jgi:hypothetical protein